MSGELGSPSSISRDRKPYRPQVQANNEADSPPPILADPYLQQMWTNELFSQADSFLMHPPISGKPEFTWGRLPQQRMWGNEILAIAESGIAQAQIHAQEPPGLRTQANDMPPDSLSESMPMYISEDPEPTQSGPYQQPMWANELLAQASSFLGSPTQPQIWTNELFVAAQHLSVPQYIPRDLGLTQYRLCQRQMWTNDSPPVLTGFGQSEPCHPKVRTNGFPEAGSLRELTDLQIQTGSALSNADSLPEFVGLFHPPMQQL
ncbi:MAG: hypothetical protein M1839_007918 [Geoglossum umbratile]|nr:MAG: hypothetical protein M1839_007918 [Geoglossum umbratile]